MKAIELKVLEMVNRVTDYLHGDERGQTTAEYVAVTAVGVALALAVVYVALKDALNAAVAEIAAQLASFIPLA